MRSSTFKRRLSSSRRARSGHRSLAFELSAPAVRRGALGVAASVGARSVGKVVSDGDRTCAHHRAAVPRGARGGAPRVQSRLPHVDTRHQNARARAGVRRPLDSAARTLERGVQLYPSAPGMRSTLLFAYASAGRWADAERIRSQLRRSGIILMASNLSLRSSSSATASRWCAGS